MTVSAEIPITITAALVNESQWIVARWGDLYWRRYNDGIWATPDADGILAIEQRPEVIDPLEQAYASWQRQQERSRKHRPGRQRTNGHGSVNNGRPARYQKRFGREQRRSE